MLNTNINLSKELTSGWELGEPPNPESIRQGTVRMEDHPDSKCERDIEGM
jgi:hypothetical protein